jgi:hypothetical protein
MQNQLYYILDIHASQTSIRIKQGLSRRLQLYMYNLMGMLLVFTSRNVANMRLLRKPQSQQLS